MVLIWAKVLQFFRLSVCGNALQAIYVPVQSYNVSRTRNTEYLLQYPVRRTMLYSRYSRTLFVIQVFTMVEVNGHDFMLTLPNSVGPYHTGTAVVVPWYTSRV